MSSVGTATGYEMMNVGRFPCIPGVQSLFQIFCEQILIPTISFYHPPAEWQNVMFSVVCVCVDLLVEFGSREATECAGSTKPKVT